MHQPLPNRITVAALVLVVSVLFPFAARVPAAEISGTIPTTLTIFFDSELKGDVTCAVPVTAPGPPLGPTISN
jgi:hypothetical protein